MTRRRQLAVLGKNRDHSRSWFDLLVQSLQPVGRTHAHAVFGKQCKERKAFGQIRLGQSLTEAVELQPFH